VGGPPDQPYYLNAAAALDAALPADQLLREMLDLEFELGRRRAEQWGPRTIDLDLLLYDDQVFNEPELTVPHRHMHQRGFVLAPLVEIAPNARHPIYKMTVAALLQSLEGLRPINDFPKDKSSE
jgi:2-amino-4-hydroxy-6-hydroxymethyldihydropteridine diphosphokinase